MRVKKRQYPFFKVLILLLGSFTLSGQPYVSGGHTRHRFAQLNLGTDNRVFLPGGAGWTAQNAGGTSEWRPLGAHGESRLIIGGTHFWGHADLYLATPLVTFGGRGFSTGAESVVQIFPWRIEHRKIRPYAGFSWQTIFYQYGDGARLKRFRVPLLAGFLYNHDQHLFELGGGYNYRSKLPYYTGPTTQTTVEFPQFWLSFAYKMMFETTLSNERNWRNGRTRMQTDSLAALHRLNGLTFAVGPSEAVFLRRSPRNAQVAPSIDQHRATKVFPEIAIGYYLNRPDIQVNLMYRGYRSAIGAYGYSQQARRRALGVEVYRFWFDYHGFALFAGPSLSREWLSVTETPAGGSTRSGTFQGFRPGFSFGWDIRPNRLQTYYLRTNLRYVPNLAVEMPDQGKVYFDALELNFIQLVVFPGRIGKNIQG